LKSISNSKTKEQEHACQQQIQNLEFTAPFEPVRVAHIHKADANEQSRIGGVKNIGKSVAEGEGRTQSWGEMPKTCAIGTISGISINAFAEPEGMKKFMISTSR
jgi:hypothetical protein